MSYHIGVLHARLSNLKVRGHGIERHTALLQRMRGWVGCEINTSTKSSVLINQGFVVLMVCSAVKIKMNLLWLSTSGQQSGSLPFQSIVFQIFAETVLRHQQKMMNTVLECTLDKLVPSNYHPHKTIKATLRSKFPSFPASLSNPGNM